MGEKVIRINSILFILFLACFFVACTGAFFLGNAYSKSGNNEHSERDSKYSRQMGRASELLESVDGRIGGVQDGLGRIKVYLGQDSRDLRGLAERLQFIAIEVESMEKYLDSTRSDISNFCWHYDSCIDIELR